MKRTIPDKYLDTNLKAMLSAEVFEPEPDEIEEPEKESILHINKFISFFKRKYKLEVSITKEDT